MYINNNTFLHPDYYHYIIVIIITAMHFKSLLFVHGYVVCVFLALR